MIVNENIAERSFSSLVNSDLDIWSRMDGDKTIVRNKVRVSLYNGPFAIWTILSDRLIKNTLKLSECSCLSDH